LAFLDKCVNRAGSVPPVSADLRTTGTITTTGANALGISTGVNYWYGLTFNSGSGAVASGPTINAAGFNYFKSCHIAKKGTTSSTTAMVFGTATSNVGHRLILDGPTLEFGHASDSIALRGTALHAACSRSGEWGEVAELS
jgi:hypothetical protein